MYKLLLLLLIGCFISINTFSTRGVLLAPEQKEVLMQNNYQDFEQLISTYNKLVYTKPKEAVTYLKQAEELALQFAGDDLLNANASLALSFSLINNKAKAQYYQQKGTAKSRGNNLSISIVNLNKLAQSFNNLKDKKGLQLLFFNALNNASATKKTPIKIAYVNGLYGAEEYNKAATILNELYTDTPLPTEERAEILCLLIVNSIKLNQNKNIANYYKELAALNTPKNAAYYLASGMYLSVKNDPTQAIKQYHKLIPAFKNGERGILYIEGVLQLAKLYSQQFSKDSATYYFKLVDQTVKKPYHNSAIGIQYLKLYREHLKRFNKNAPVINQAIKIKDSIYKNELITVTKELTYKHKIEQDKQKAILLNKQKQLSKQRFLLITSCLGLLVIIAIAIIYNLQQRKKQNNLLHLAEVQRLKQLHKTEVIKKLSASQEAERWRIADQLHDEIGSMISVARLNLSPNPLKKEILSEEKLNTANRILADVATTVREMSHELMPVAIRQYGLISAIEQLINDINISGKLFIEHLIYGFEDSSKYPEDFQVSFYRIVQELFQNIVKHSKATNAIFQLVEHPDSINLYIEDNGKGLVNKKLNKEGKGIGLLTNRIDYYEGKISIEGEPGKGTLIVIDIPTAHMIGK